MPDSRIRDLHDAVARSDDPVIASTRPLSTRPVEMRRMVSDVLAKLRPDRLSVLELGCGTGVLGAPIIGRASRYVGVDLSGEAVAAFRDAVPGAVLRIADVTVDDLSDLGEFDRVLVYATLHLVTTEEEGETFVRNALGLLAPGGRALFGNLPLPDADLPHSAAHRVAGLAWSVGRRVGRRPARQVFANTLPPGYCLPLTRNRIERWLHGVPNVHWRWEAPKVGVPMHRTRADLIVEKDSAAAVQDVS